MQSRNDDEQHPGDERYTLPLSERLLIAMAPAMQVLGTFGNAREEQDRFAALLSKHADRLSESYVKYLAVQYVSFVEKSRDGMLESDDLMELLMTRVHDCVPQATDTCMLSFEMPATDAAQAAADDDSETVLRIRIFPYHNDVSLRLWEAGACLAEFCMRYPQHVADRRVIEIGAGVGLTSLVVAGVCKATSVYMTDYTPICIENMQHNIAINTDWIKRRCSPPNDATSGDASWIDSVVSEGYLEWNAFAEDTREESLAAQQECDAGTRRTLTEFFAADVLLAADVIYDVSVIESLVLVMRNFLRASSSAKFALFAIMKRNLTTFETLMRHLDQHNVECAWLARGDACEQLPYVFPCKFNQPRHDVCIAKLTRRC